MQGGGLLDIIDPGIADRYTAMGTFLEASGDILAAVIAFDGNLFAHKLEGPFIISDHSPCSAIIKIFSLFSGFLQIYPILRTAS
jgi:hypothetical protein